MVPESEEAHVAIKLREMTQALEDQVRLARESKQSPFLAGKQLFLLANYAEAARSLQKVISSATSDSSEKLQSRYLYARSQEELGQDSDAVLTYRTVIQASPNSEEAKKSNRRLYVLGQVLQQRRGPGQVGAEEDGKVPGLQVHQQPEDPGRAPAQGSRRSVVTPPADEVADAAGGQGSLALEKLDKLDVGDLKGQESDKEKKAKAESAEKANAAEIGRHAQEGRADETDGDENRRRPPAAGGHFRDHRE